MASEIPFGHADYQNSLSATKDNFMPSDRVQKKITNVQKFQQFTKVINCKLTMQALWQTTVK